LAREEMGMETVERDIDRSELYVAEECFMTGTAAHVTPVVELDHRPIGSGKAGPVAKRLMQIYFDVITARNSKYASWCTPCYSKVKA
jgi:branched-chain amino acid aminotransferase